MRNSSNWNEDCSPTISEEDLVLEPGLRQPVSWDRKRRRLVGWMAAVSVVLGLAGAAGLFYLLSRNEVAARAPAPEPAVNRKELGKNVFFEVQGETRRVTVKTKVCLRDGQLEGLLCRKFTKEHEYVLSGDFDAAVLHTALLLAKAVPGSPVKYEPKYTPASGTPIKITLNYEKDGKKMSVPAQQWLRSGREGNKVLEQDWVFGGSLLIPAEEKGKPPIYLANHGDVVCVCNMEDAMLDLPVRSPTKLEDRVYTAFTDRIPPLDTPVEVVFEPILPKKK